MLLEILECHATTLFLFTTLLAVLAIFSLTKQPRLHLPPSPLALPIIGHIHLLGPLIHHSFHKLSLRYGPFFHLRLGSVRCIVATSPELAKELLITNELTFSTRERSSAVEHLTYNGSAFAFATYGPYWRFIKKLCMTELVGVRTLNGFLALRTKEYHRFLRLVMEKSKTGQAVNITEELLKLTNSIICQMMLSISCSETEDQAEEARTIVRDVTRIFGEFNVSDFIWFCKNLDLQGFNKRAKDILRRYDALLGKIIKDRQELRNKRKREKETCKVVGEDVKDFLDTLLDAMEDEKSDIKMTTDHIKALVLDFFTAGTDTTAIVVEWALAELINNPVVLQKARDEIKQVVGTERLVEESDNPNLPYIQAIVKETFRLHPPVPVISRKSINACNVSGYDIPENTLLFVNIWSIGRNPTIWADPLKFSPERFLESPGEGSRVGSLVDVKGQHFQLLPFGTGRRGCPGMTFAMQELSTILAATIQCFELNVVGGKGEGMNGDRKVVDMSERSGLTAPRVHDLVCVPVARISGNILDH